MTMGGGEEEGELLLPLRVGVGRRPPADVGSKHHTRARTRRQRPIAPPGLRGGGRDDDDDDDDDDGARSTTTGEKKGRCGTNNDGTTTTTTIVPT